MRSALIGKIEKAKRYAQEPRRLSLDSFRARLQGEHDAYTLRYEAGAWNCSCPFFSQWGQCSHTMAGQRLLALFLPQAS
ncbi:MAG TPA: hypothetical protein VJ565_04345 [Dehalococcoidia bacterium]|nr:hypothetical protein [Dehalococcoidia bacterium]